MPAHRTIPPQQCAAAREGCAASACRGDFRPRTARLGLNPWACCCRPCAGRLMHHRDRRRVSHLAELAAKSATARHRDAIESSIYEKFGELTPREIALFNAAAKVGFKRGYDSGYSRAGRRNAA